MAGRSLPLRLQTWRWAASLSIAMMPGSISALPLEEAVRRGLAINPQVRTARLDEKAADTDISIAKGGYYPAVSVSGGPQSLDLNGFGYDVTVAQMLLDWGRVASGVDNATAQQRKLAQQLRLVTDEAALDIVETYLDILMAERQIAALDAHIERLTEIQDMTIARSDGGYADRSEPERATLELTRAQEQRIAEHGTLRDARNQYVLLVGEEAASLEEPSPVSVAEYVGRNDLEAIVLASPLYGKAQEDTKVAQANLKETRSSLFPQLNLEASTLRRDIGGRAQSDTIVGLRFRLNNIQGFSSFLRPRGAQQRVESAIWKEAVVQRDTRRQVRTQFDTAEMIRLREDALQAQVTGADAVSETYLEQFKVGRRDVIDLLNVQRERFDASRQLITLHIERLRAEYRAAALLGLIGPLIEKELR